MQIYIDKDAGSTQETNQGTRVVLDLVEDIENSGPDITCDNFFPNLSLTQKLFQKKPSLIGTKKKNKPGQMTECEEHSVRFSTRPNDCIVVYKKNPCSQYAFNVA